VHKKLPQLAINLLDYHCERSLGGGPPIEFTGSGALGGLLPSVASVHYHHSYVHRSSVRVSASTGTVRSSRPCLRCPSWKFFLLLLSVTQTKALDTPVNPLLYTGMTTGVPPPCMSYPGPFANRISMASNPTTQVRVSEVCCLWRGKGK